ncbi:hypothetical protein LshimejAT787_0904670 [Lyophyllum shimeji]|uniref:Uncharacterized protein n=1 Tax=Lyophyllum shimeji TaxID=47721 RepID=A0A9P3PTW3_LYOSH|nr:hypothetical protein LshimejAT787_0904670 [Lyophyllum shimeji]
MPSIFLLTAHEDLCRGTGEAKTIADDVFSHGTKNLMTKMLQTYGISGEGTAVPCPPSFAPIPRPKDAFFLLANAPPWMRGYALLFISHQRSQQARKEAYPSSRSYWGNQSNPRGDTVMAQSPRYQYMTLYDPVMCAKSKTQRRGTVCSKAAKSSSRDPDGEVSCRRYTDFFEVRSRHLLGAFTPTFRLKPDKGDSASTLDDRESPSLAWARSSARPEVQPPLTSYDGCRLEEASVGYGQTAEKAFHHLYVLRREGMDDETDAQESSTLGTVSHLPAPTAKSMADALGDPADLFLDSPREMKTPADVEFDGIAAMKRGKGHIVESSQVRRQTPTTRVRCMTHPGPQSTPETTEKTRRRDRSPGPCGGNCKHFSSSPKVKLSTRSRPMPASDESDILTVRIRIFIVSAANPVIPAAEYPQHVSKQGSSMSCPKRARSSDEFEPATVCLHAASTETPTQKKPRVVERSLVFPPVFGFIGRIQITSSCCSPLRLGPAASVLRHEPFPWQNMIYRSLHGYLEAA